MTAHNLKDIAYVFGALSLAFGAMLIAIGKDITGFHLWPEALKLTVWTAIFTGLAFSWGYVLAWSRREDREDREA